VLIFCDFCGFISIAYTTLNKLLAVFLYNSMICLACYVLSPVRPSACHTDVSYKNG